MEESLVAGLRRQQRQYVAFYEEHGVNVARLRYHVDDWLFPDSIRGVHILDLGGGHGSLALYLTLFRDAKVTVLDAYAGHGADASNLSILLNAKEELEVENLKVHVGDVRVATLSGAQLDYICARNCFHHIYQRHDSDEPIVTLFERLHTWLKPGGGLCLSEVGWLSVWRLLPPLRQRLYPNRNFPRKSSARRWRRCAESAGFIAQDIRWYVPMQLSRLRFLLDNPLANVFLGSAYILCLRKPV